MKQGPYGKYLSVTKKGKKINVKLPDGLDENKFLADKQLEALVFGRLFQTIKQKELYERTLVLAKQITSIIK